MSEGADIR